MVRSQPIFTNDVVVVDRLSRILTPVADTSAPLLVGRIDVHRITFGYD